MNHRGILIRCSERYPTLPYKMGSYTPKDANRIAGKVQSPLASSSQLTHAAAAPISRRADGAFAALAAAAAKEAQIQRA